VEAWIGRFLNRVALKIPRDRKGTLGRKINEKGDPLKIQREVPRK